MKNSASLLNQSFIWLGISLALFTEIFIGGFVLNNILPHFIPTSLIFCAEITCLALSTLNAIYYLIRYAVAMASIISAQNKSRGTADGSVSSTDSMKLSQMELLQNFLCNLFVTSMSKDSEEKRSKSHISLYTTLSEADSKNTSLSSLVSYQDSPMNTSTSNIVTQTQLERMLAEEDCDAVVDTRCLPFTSDMVSGYAYQAGVPYKPTEAENSSYDRLKSLIEKDLSRSGQFPTHRKPSEALPTFETDLMKILKYYSISYSDLETCEIKLRIWLCNTILRPLVLKIEEINGILAEKYPGMHLKIGSSSVEVLKSGLLHRQELCNIALPFIMPYLQAHQNQAYLVRRIQELSENIALEDFKWNNGGIDFVRDEKNELTRFINWTDQFPTDVDLIWHIFCTYMDLHLSPSPNASVFGEHIRAFSTVYFVNYPGSGFPIAAKENPDAFFIRMTARQPPNFELVINGSDTILQPLKDSSHNFWLVFILFLKHVHKYNNARLGHLSLSSISLNIFDL